MNEGSGLELRQELYADFGVVPFAYGNSGVHITRQSHICLISPFVVLAFWSSDIMLWLPPVIGW